MSTEKNFKKKHKFAACTQQPWKYLIPADIREDTLKKIRQETLQAYGYEMDQCTKRMVCLTKKCLGRELPWLSATAKPYLEILRTTHNITDNQLFLSNCDTCPIKLSCTSVCGQVNDYMNRRDTKSVDLIFQETLENHEPEPYVETLEAALPIAGEIPWDCVSDKRQQVVKKYLYEGKDFLTIAKELDLNNQARVKYEFYSTLTKFSEYAIMRKFLEENEKELTHKQVQILTMVYKTNLSIQQVADVEGKTKQAIQQLLTRLIKKYNIQWETFVRKRKNKVIYSVPEVMK